MRRRSKPLVRVAPSIVALAALMLIPFSPARASLIVEPSGETTYSITMNDGAPIVANVMLFQKFANTVEETSWWYYASGDGETTDIVRPYYSSPPVSTLLLGVVLGLPSGQPWDLHLVMMMSDAAASASDGVAWQELFGNADEEALIEALLSPSGDGSFETLRAFTENQAKAIPSGGSTVSAWFAPGDTFKVVAFSDGQIIGSGTSKLEPFGPAAVPEPTSLALAGLGVLGVLAYDRSRRRRAAA